MLEAGEVLLRVDDRIEVAAIGHVDGQFAQSLDIGADLPGMQEGRHVGDAHAFDQAVLLDVARFDQACRRVDAQHARLARRHQLVLERHGHRPDGAMTAHRQAARRFDEQERDVAIGAGRRIEDRPGHHVVSAGLEAQAGADPVELGEEMGALLHHGGAHERRAAARHETHRVAARVTVDAEERVPGHGFDAAD